MVLLYEPDPDIAPLFRFLLEYLGCSVRVAATLAEASEIVREQPPALAVVRPDPASDGWAICRQIHGRIGAPVIGLLPPEAVGEPTVDLHILPLPVDLNVLRTTLFQLLTTITVT